MEFETLDNGVVSVARVVLGQLALSGITVDMLDEAIEKVICPENGGPLLAQVKLGRLLGPQSCVHTSRITVYDRTTFAQWLHKQGFCRVVTDVVGEATSQLTLIARRDKVESRLYHLITAWLGSRAEKNPYDPSIRGTRERRRCFDYWLEHALIWTPLTMGPVFVSTWAELAQRYNR